jgi:flavin-dependent dehydrogenase
MRFEVAVVGAGPAGCTTALALLARDPTLAGRVALIERHAHPREKYCAGAISAWGLDVLARLGLDPLARGLPIRAVAVRANGSAGRSARDGLGVVVRRSVFDASLAREAQARGAVLLERCAVESIARTTDGFTIATHSRRLDTRVVVGADGASGTTRRALGIAEPTRRARLYLVETPGAESRDDVANGTLLFDLDPTLDDGLQGYYWDFAAPLDGVAGTSRGIFDLNTRRATDPGALKRVLGRKLAQRGVRLADVRLKAHSIRTFRPDAPLAVHGALLVGEAAGVDPVTGEGIAHALAMGELAGARIASALARRNVAFDDWTAHVNASFVGRHLRQACAIASWVYGRQARRLCGFLARSERARDLSVRWYRGERVTRGEQIELFVRLAFGGQPAADD